jgi:hypothetical protein
LDGRALSFPPGGRWRRLCGAGWGAEAAAIAVAFLLLLLPSFARAIDFSVDRWTTAPDAPSVVLAQRATPDAAMAIVFHTGTVTDAGTGLTRITQHVLLEDDSRHPYDQFAASVWSAGGSISLRTGRRESAFVLSAPAAEFQKLAPVLLEMILAPQPRKERLEAFRMRTVNDLEVDASSTGLEALISRLTTFDERYADGALGSRERVERANFTMVKDELAGPMSPANATVIFAGPIDGETARKWLKRFHGGAAQHESPPRLSIPPDLAIFSPEEVFLLGFQLDIHDDRGAAAVRLLAPLLEARMLKRLRTAGAGYALAAVPVLSSWQQILAVYVPLFGNPGLDLKKAMLEDVQAVSGGKITDDEVEEARGQALQQLRMIDAHPAALADALVSSIGLESLYGPDMVARVQTLKRAEVVTLVSPWLVDAATFFVHFSPSAGDER